MLNMGELLLKGWEEGAFEKGVGVRFIIHNEGEWELPYYEVSGSIVGEFCHGDEDQPFLELTIAKDSKIGFQLLIVVFGFSIHLGMVGSGESYVIFQEASQFVSKCRGKLQATIGDY